MIILRLKKIYLLLVLVTALMAIYTIYTIIDRPDEGIHPAELREGFTLIGEKGIIKFVIRNPDNRGINYTYLFLGNNTVYVNHTVYIPGKNPFHGSLTFNLKDIETSEIIFLVFKDSKLEPITNTTFYIPNNM